MEQEKRAPLQFLEISVWKKSHPHNMGGCACAVDLWEPSWDYQSLDWSSRKKDKGCAAPSSTWMDALLDWQQPSKSSRWTQTVWVARWCLSSFPTGTPVDFAPRAVMPLVPPYSYSPAQSQSIVMPAFSCGIKYVLLKKLIKQLMLLWDEKLHGLISMIKRITHISILLITAGLIKHSGWDWSGENVYICKQIFSGCLLKLLGVEKPITHWAMR